MKKLLLPLLLLFSLFINAQSVNDIPLKDIDVDYVLIVGTSKMFTKKVTIEIDFGQHTKFFSSGQETQIKDENGKNMVFNSMIDALNFMNRNGFMFVNAYAISVGNQNVYHFLLKNNKNEKQ